MRFQVEVRIMESLRLDIQEYMKFIFIDSLMSKKNPFNLLISFCLPVILVI